MLGYQLFGWLITFIESKSSNEWEDEIPYLKESSSGGTLNSNSLISNTVDKYD